MKSFAIFVILVLVVLFNPMAAFGQHSPTNSIMLETLPDSTQLAVTIEGELYDDGFSKLIVKGLSGSDSMTIVFEEAHTFTGDNPTYVFELDYPFLPNETYFAYVMNGWNAESILWVPNSVTQEEPEKEKPTTQDTAETSSKQINELQSAISQEEITFEQVSPQNSFESLIEENEFLRQQIEKKDAIIFEQLKVILDLASTVSSTIFEPRLDVFSLV